MQKIKVKKPSIHTFAKAIPFVLLIAGVLGLVLACTLMYETIQLNNNSNYIPNCDLNPILNCGSVITAEKSFLHGYLNPIIGLMAFPVLVTTGVVLLSGIKLKRWYWLGLELGALGGLGFIAWLLYVSLYRVHALCPYCLGIWTLTIVTFWYVTLYNIQAGNIKVATKLRPLTNFMVRHHIDILVVWILLIAAAILKHFWYYYGHYF